MIIQALKKGLIEHEASDTGGVPRWKSSCPDRLTEATISRYRYLYILESADTHTIHGHTDQIDHDLDHPEPNLPFPDVLQDL